MDIRRLDYDEGYFKGLVDAVSWFDHHSIMLKHERINIDDMLRILWLMIEHRDQLMRLGCDLEIDMRRDAKGKKVWSFVPHERRR